MTQTAKKRSVSLVILGLALLFLMVGGAIYTLDNTAAPVSPSSPTTPVVTRFDEPTRHSIYKKLYAAHIEADMAAGRLYPDTEKADEKIKRKNLARQEEYRTKQQKQNEAPIQSQYKLTETDIALILSEAKVKHWWKSPD